MGTPAFAQAPKLCRGRIPVTFLNSRAARRAPVRTWRSAPDSNCGKARSRREAVTGSRPGLLGFECQDAQIAERKHCRPHARPFRLRFARLSTAMSAAFTGLLAPEDGARLPHQVSTNTAPSIPRGSTSWVRARRASLALLPQRPRQNESSTGASEPAQASPPIFDFASR
jgi:hypothetical protein